MMDVLVWNKGRGQRLLTVIWLHCYTLYIMFTSGLETIPRFWCVCLCVFTMLAIRRVFNVI